MQGCLRHWAESQYSVGLELRGGTHNVAAYTTSMRRSLIFELGQKWLAPLTSAIVGLSNAWTVFRLETAYRFKIYMSTCHIDRLHMADALFYSHINLISARPTCHTEVIISHYLRRDVLLAGSVTQENRNENRMPNSSLKCQIIPCE